MKTVKKSILSIQYVLIIIGLLFIIAANLFDGSVLKVDLDEAVANLGVLLFLTGSIQWLFDTYLRKELHQEIAEMTVKNVNVATSGIVNVLNDSKRVEYAETIAHSAKLIIGIHYSPRLLEDYFHDFLKRSIDGLNATIVIIDLSSEQGKLVAANDAGNEHISPNLKKIYGIVSEINEKGAGKIEVLKHQATLRYSFVQSDGEIWVTPYRNSRGRSKVPALQVRRGTELHDFFESDIIALLEQSA